MISIKTLTKIVLLGALCLSAGCTVSGGGKKSSQGETLKTLSVSNLKQLTVRNSVNSKVTAGTSYENAKDLFGRDCDEKKFDKDEKLFYCDYYEEGIKNKDETNALGLVFTKNSANGFELTFMAYRGPDLPQVNSSPEAINMNTYLAYQNSKALYPELTIGTDLFLDKSAYVTLDGGIDGDTSYFNVFGTYDGVQKHHSQITRFLGVDTPETNHPTYGLQPWGNAGKQYTNDREKAAINIVLELDSYEIWDTYGRLLAYVWLDGILLCLELLEMGIANPRYSSHNAYFDQMSAGYFERESWQLVINLTDPNWKYDSPNYVNNSCPTKNCEKSSGYRYNFTYGL